MNDEFDRKDMAYPTFWLGALHALSDDLQARADDSRIRADDMLGEVGELILQAKAVAYQDAENRVRAVMNRLASEAGVELSRFMDTPS